MNNNKKKKNKPMKEEEEEEEEEEELTLFENSRRGNGNGNETPALLVWAFWVLWWVCSEKTFYPNIGPVSSASGCIHHFLWMHIEFSYDVIRFYGIPFKTTAFILYYS